MFVKYIILDGFKSYARETTVGPFDEHFNAITGLNGTGKSNILDAICFVLGISSLSTVRAQRLEDLISKAKIKGREAIKTAKASIVLDNRDKTPGKCPIGYEHCNEIVVSRTIEQRDDQKEIVSKYHLNGAITQKNVVADLFESVRLDVNNPNFMIMQGKITKVVNMKPKELLQMIEDTVGATLYQHKREKTLSALENSQRQLIAAESVMKDTIQSAYEAQKIAVKEVAEFRKLEAQVDIVEKKYAVAQYLYLQERHRKISAEVEHLKLADANDQAGIDHHRELIQQLKERAQELKREKGQHVKVSEVEKEMSALSRKFAAEEAKLQAVRTNKDEAKQKVKRAIKERDDERKKIEDHKIQQQSLIREFENCNASINYATAKIEEFTNKLDKITYGSVIDETGEAVNIQEKLNGVEETIRALKGPNDIKKAELASEKKVIVEKERTLKKTPSDDQVEADYRRAEAEVQRLSQSLREFDINPTEMSELENSVHQAKQQLSSIEREYERAYHQYPYLRFNYQDPYQGFDRNAVHGLVYELFTVSDMERFKVALEVAAGGYFSQVVVESPDISKLLISRGNLRFRTTFLPLSALSSRHHVPRQVELDRKLGKNKAFPAIDLVQYEGRYRTLMENVFGSAVICIDMSVAKAVAYQMKYRAITLDGDVVDPGGTMQGGTRRNAGTMLETCQNLVELKREKERLRYTVQEGQQKIDVCRRNSKMIQAHEAATRRLQHCKEVLALTAHATLKEELNNLRKGYLEKEKEAREADAKISVLVKEENSLRHKLKMENQIREKNKREVDTELKRFKRELQLAEKLKKSKESLYKDIEIDLKAKAALLDSYDKDIDEAKKNEAECIEALKIKEEEFSKVQEEHLRQMQELEAAIEAQRQHEKQMEKVADDILATEKKIDKIELARQKRAYNMKTVDEKFEGIKKHIVAFLEAYPNMEFRDDMEPLSSRSAHTLKTELDKLKATKEDRQARLNFKAAEALPRTEKDMTEYVRMRRKMDTIKGYLGDILKKLDSQKSYLVQNAYKKVNTEFDFMMNTLLPQSHAKLVPVNPSNIADGVVIHVCLAGCWKESLTELSGGQRSLVALSLVLALCLYNPAPFYILDEIDSALDVNHTSNIGFLIKEKFPQVQFICVSLKDGMYNNANVLFTTYFDDGTSKVKARVKKVKQSAQGSR